MLLKDSGAYRAVRLTHGKDPIDGSCYTGGLPLPFIFLLCTKPWRLNSSVDFVVNNVCSITWRGDVWKGAYSFLNVSSTGNLLCSQMGAPASLQPPELRKDGLTIRGLLLSVLGSCPLGRSTAALFNWISSVNICISCPTAFSEAGEDPFARQAGSARNYHCQGSWCIRASDSFCQVGNPGTCI